MVGKERDYLMIMGVTYTAVIASQFLLVPVYGPLGAAIPNAVGAAVWSIWAVSRLRSEVGIDPSLAGLVSPPAGPAMRTEPAE